MEGATSEGRPGGEMLSEGDRLLGLAVAVSDSRDYEVPWKLLRGRWRRVIPGNGGTRVWPGYSLGSFEPEPGSGCPRGAVTTPRPVSPLLRGVALLCPVPPAFPLVRRRSQGTRCRCPCLRFLLRFGRACHRGRSWGRRRSGPSSQPCTSASISPATSIDGTSLPHRGGPVALPLLGARSRGCQPGRGGGRSLLEVTKSRQSWRRRQSPAVEPSCGRAGENSPCRCQPWPGAMGACGRPGWHSTAAPGTLRPHRGSRRCSPARLRSEQPRAWLRASGAGSHRVPPCSSGVPAGARGAGGCCLSRLLRADEPLPARAVLLSRGPGRAAQPASVGEWWC